MNHSNQWLSIWSPDGRETREIHVRDAAKLAQVHRTTVLRWIQRNHIPPHYLALLQFRALGCLPGKEWQRWRVRGDLLVNTESGEHYLPFHMRAAYLAHDQVRDLKRQIERLRARIEVLTRDRPAAPVLQLVAPPVGAAVIKSAF